MQIENLKRLYMDTMIDGSTYVALFDLGMGITIKRKAKLINIKCHNTHVPQGVESKKFVEETIRGRKLWAKTFEDPFGKYATILIVLYIQTGPDEFVNMNDLLIEKQLAFLVKDSAQ